MSKVTNGCNGDCCEAFRLNVSLSKFKRLAKQGKGLAYHGNAKDIQTIAAMLIPLDYAPYHSGKSRAYTCAHFDKEKRECTIYDSRPQLCRSFPHGQICGHCGTRANSQPPTKAWSVFLKNNPDETTYCR